MFKKVILFSMLLLLGAFITAQAEELIINGDISSGTTGWTLGVYGGSADLSASNGNLEVNISSSGTEDWNIQLVQKGLSLQSGQTYVVSFDVWAGQSTTIVQNIGMDGEPYTSYSQSKTFSVNSSKQTISYSFTMNQSSDENTRFEFNLGLASGTIYLDNLSLSTEGTTPTTPAPVNKLGDVDRNGTINILDALMTAQLSVGLSVPAADPAQADVNCDDVLNIVDALMIAQYYVGLISQFPCSPQVTPPPPTIAPTNTPKPTPTGSGPTKKWNHTVSRHGQLQAAGKGTKDAHGNMVSFGGNSWFWSHDYTGFWNPDLMEWLVTQWRTQIVRLPMAIAPNFHNDQLAWYKNREYALNQMVTMVDKAIELDVYVVIDFHSHHAQDIKNHAIDFFTEMASRYGQYDNVMFEIYNEPLTDAGTIASYADEIISIIRQYSDNLIIVGTPSWSSRPSQMPNISGGNIAYTYHYYVSMGHWSIHSSEMDCGKPIMITECGNDGADMWKFINKAKANHQSMMSWSVCGKQTSADGPDSNWSIFQGHITGNEGSWSDNDLSQAGKDQKEIIFGWGNYKAPVPLY